MSSLDVRQVAGGIVLGVKVVPGSSRTELVGEYNGMLKIKLSAAPEKGKANKCLIEFMAEILKVRKSCISIISGETKAVKQIQIVDVAPERVVNSLGNLVDSC
jgi:uncharacterized protein (TIGR00251 family)